MTHEKILGELARLGLAAAEAKRAAAATVRALGEVLDPALADELSRELPRPLAAAMLHGAPQQPPEAFHARVAAHAGLPEPVARERADVVCALLAPHVGGELRARIARDLGRDVFASRETGAPPPHAPGAPAPPHTLASGRPGYRHPLSESPPGAGAHEHSVARSDDPHADTKLSSATGTTQERTHETVTTKR